MMSLTGIEWAAFEFLSDSCAFISTALHDIQNLAGGREPVDMKAKWWGHSGSMGLNR